jgi:hypothetical protein
MRLVAENCCFRKLGLSRFLLFSPMAHQKKKPRKQPSIIDSELDHRFSASDGSPDTSSSDHSTDTSTGSVPLPSTAQPKRRHARNASQAADKIADVDKPETKLNYILSVYSPSEMKKPAAKRRAKTSSIQLLATEPWDTIKAQLLVKIDSLLKPKSINFEDYDIICTIPRIITKPGIPLASSTDYNLLLERSHKSNLINVTITPSSDPSDKENDSAEDEGVKKTKGTRQRRDPATLLGNVNKVAQISLLQERWKCPKQTPVCFGAHCFINTDGEHIPLSHPRMECWASAIVSVCSLSR